MKRINCRQLVMTLSNVEEGESNDCGVICVYDMEDSELCVAIFNTIRTCAVFFGVPTPTISSVLFKNVLYKKRFKIERVKL